MANDYTNALTDLFVPEVWHAELLTALDPLMVWTSGLVSNRDYTGDITGQGDICHINALVSPTVGSYNDTTGMSIEQLKTVEQDLPISEADYVAFYVGDIESVQVAGALSQPASRRSIQELAKSADTFMAGVAAAKATASTLDLSSVTASADKGEALLDHLFDGMQQLDEHDISSDSRWAIVSPQAKRYLLRAAAVANASEFGQGGATANGVVARLAGFTIMSTTQMPSGVDLMVGQRDFLTFASQFQDFRVQPVEKFRRNQVDSLHVYGAKCVRYPGLDTVKSDNTFDESIASPGLIKTTVTWTTG
ncbi:hypothetical protein OG417_20570 [Actinoallomurus sp. NBC_01490]|uniref:hypothetical protein n=1 Tax=Actinoallomurus sp. NBC_01490 TaxID=2903557 RepID=UPI002E35841B|nr:hypothetical protein [Actinoallomurus sp. NBC_01490]